MSILEGSIDYRKVYPIKNLYGEILAEKTMIE